MKASELRIGNLVNYGGVTSEVTRVDKLFFYCEASDIPNFTKDEDRGAKPIELNEEWLLKFGFVKYKYGHNTYRQKSFIIEEGLLKNSPYEFRKRILKDTSLGLTYIKYVHQIQNLYFALTGEELTLKSDEDESK